MNESESRFFRYTIKYYTATLWSFFTQADHFDEVEVSSPLTLEEFARQVVANGIELPTGDAWLMPGAILEIRKS